MDEAIEKKQVFLVARDEKNYYGGGVPRPDKDCFLATKDALVLCTELGVEGNIDDMNRDEHQDFSHVPDKWRYEQRQYHQSCKGKDLSWSE